MEETPEIHSLKLQWVHARTHRERAELEAKMWQLAPLEERKPGRAKYVSRLLSISLRPAEARASLHNAAQLADPLWERVDGPEMMLIESATRVLQRARLRAVAENLPEPEALKRELVEYDSWVPVRTEAGVFRKRPQRPRGMAATSAPVGAGASRDRWAAVRASIKRVVDIELAKVGDMHTRGKLRAQLESEVSTLVDLFMARVRRERKNATLNDAPLPLNLHADRKALRAACQLLSVDPPIANDCVDHLTYTTAKKHFRKLAMEYHPDHNLDPGAVDRYKEVVDAMQLVETSYQERNTTKDATHGE